MNAQLLRAEARELIRIGNQITVLADELDKNKIRTPVGQSEILEATSHVTGIPSDIILGRSRTEPIAEARWIFAYVARSRGIWTMMDIARYLGRDHTTIVHVMKEMPWRILQSKKLADQIKMVESIVGQRKEKE